MPRLSIIMPPKKVMMQTRDDQPATLLPQMQERMKMKAKARKDRTHMMMPRTDAA